MPEDEHDMNKPGTTLKTKEKGEILNRQQRRGYFNRGAHTIKRSKVR
jgi:hypothetical protein